MDHEGSWSSVPSTVHDLGGSPPIYGRSTWPAIAQRHRSRASAVKEDEVSAGDSSNIGSGRDGCM